MVDLSKFDVAVDAIGAVTASTFNEKLANDPSYLAATEKTEQQFILDVEKYMSHNFRYYQKEALAAFDYFLRAGGDNWFKQNLYENIGDRQIPFYGFEMATGSGKTLLMGALILYLWKHHGQKNFLIIVPSTEIYEKTIHNFDSNHIKRVFSNYLVEKYNLVTGDNFTDRSSNYDPDAAFSIYVFTVQKFFERASGEQVLKVDKPWEESPWKRGGDTISFREFLKERGLVVLTDEAHHYQNYRVSQEGNKSSGDVIADFGPQIVLEFTATAVTDDPSSSKRNQKIIYDYPINRFLDDGYGKKVRAFGYTGGVGVSEDATVSEEDKRKFLVAFLIHMVKKKALALADEESKPKPILLVRAREIEHADNLLPEIEKICLEDSLIEEVYSEITGGRKYDITELVRANVTLDEFKKDIKAIPGKAFVYHSKNASNLDIREKIDTIETNDQEILIQIKKLEEGWDLLNPYTILILSNNTGTSVKRYVRQLIGRGVRLFREKRIRGDLTGLLEEQEEVLHVVCNKGTSFHEFIESIREGMGLSKKQLEEETFTAEKRNRINPDFGKYINLKLPKIKIIHTFSLSPDALIEKLTYEGLELQQWLEEHTAISDGLRFWRITEEDTFAEKSMSDEADLDRGHAPFKPEELKLDPMKEIRAIVRYVIDNQSVLPSLPATRQKLTDAIAALNTKGLMYKKHNQNSRVLYGGMLSRSLRTHLVNVINGQFTEILHEDMLELHRIFPEEKIRVEQDPDSGAFIGIKKWNEFHKPDIVTSTHLGGNVFTGFNKSWFEFNSFDVGPEFRLAIVLDNCPDVEFWIRNRRHFGFCYGSHWYYPDFIVYANKKLYIIEPKGSQWLESERVKQELKILSDIRRKGYGSLFLLDKTINEKIYGRSNTFSDIIKNDDLEVVLKSMG